MARKRSARRKNGAARPPTRSRIGGQRLWLGVFLAAVFATKCLILSQLGGHPLLQPEAAGDSAAYVRLAREVLSGNVLLGPGLYYLSPLYTYFLAVILAGGSFALVRVVQIALGTAAV